MNFSISLHCVEALVSAAFAPPRKARSHAYREGVRLALMARVSGTPIVCPWADGLAEADAFYAGCQEGLVIYRTEVDPGPRAACVVAS